MAITIIKGGKNKFVGHCKWCGCDFRYTADDVLKTTCEIVCPFCQWALKHLGEHGTSTQAASSGIPWASYYQNYGQAFKVK